MIALAAALLLQNQDMFAGRDRRPTALAGYHGTCQSLVLAGTDVTIDCQSSLISFTYSDGSISFAAVLGQTDRQTLVSFLGHPSPVGTTTDLYFVTMAKGNATGEGVDTGQDDATGTCTHGDLLHGVVTVSCSASTADGVYSMTFVSDGADPMVQPLD